MLCENYVYYFFYTSKLTQDSKNLKSQNLKLYKNRKITVLDNVLQSSRTKWGVHVRVCIYLLYDDLFIYREICYTHTHIFVMKNRAHMIMEVKFQFCHLQAGDPGKLVL